MNYGPLVIVGQARSGSTLVTRILAEAGPALLVNDAYYLQFADGLRPHSPLTADEARAIGRHVVAMMRRRAVTPSIRTVNRSVFLDSAQLDQLDQIARENRGGQSTPLDVVAAMLKAAAEMAEARQWGWNSPQDYMRVEQILTRFPTARILFVIRNPFDVLRSYKNLPAYWGRERRRYHPLVQSLVWRNMLREYERLSTRHPQAVRLLRYEDAIDRDAPTWRELRDFLSLEKPLPGVGGLGRNSSRSSRSPTPLSRLEAAICARIAGPYLARYGYEAAAPETHGAGLFSICAASLRCLGYYAGRALASRDMRMRLMRYAGSARPRWRARHG